MKANIQHNSDTGKEKWLDIPDVLVSVNKDLGYHAIYQKVEVGKKSYCLVTLYISRFYYYAVL